MVKQGKFMSLTASVLKDELDGLQCASFCLAQEAGGRGVQFQVTLHGVTVRNTQPQIFPRYFINRDSKRLVLLPAKKGNSKEFEWKGLLLITRGSGKLLVSGGLATWASHFYCSVSLSCLFL